MCMYNVNMSKKYMNRMQHNNIQKLAKSESPIYLILCS